MRISSRLLAISERLKYIASPAAARKRQARLCDQFGNLSRQFVQLNKLVTHNKQKRYPEKIIDDKWESYGFDWKIPVIETAMWHRKKEKK